MLPAPNPMLVTNYVLSTYTGQGLQNGHLIVQIFVWSNIPVPVFWHALYSAYACQMCSAPWHAVVVEYNLLCFIAHS